MKKVLVLGSAGMAGHVIAKYLEDTKKYNIVKISRNINCDLNIDVEKQLDKLEQYICDLEFDIIINCIGLLVKASQNNPVKAIYLNSIFPHFLELITKNTKTKIIHLSTDCVFKGDKLAYKYSEIDTPTETNWYGKSKILGELNNLKDLTIRFSIIGPELKENGTGLFHWFMRQEDKVNGYANAYWNGITTLELAKQLDKIMQTNLVGIYHLAPNNYIDKCTLLQMIATIFNNPINIIPDYSINQCKVLTTLRAKEYQPNIPSYPAQLRELWDWGNNL